ncbi:MAG: hypothetical protein HDR06_09035 [Lachnospiraceae bacterium]|nr:hypothetical protein [Lachnospiraceae bacterium]
MNINITSWNMNRKLNSISIRKNAIATLLGKHNVARNVKRDSFTKAEINDAGLYEAPMKKHKGMISEHLMSVMNDNISKVQKYGDVYVCEGVSFTADQIPKVQPDSLGEIHADNNIMDFGRNRYFKYVEKNGTEHCAYTNGKGINSVFTEYMRDESYDRVLQQYVGFWNYTMSKDPVFITKTYPEEQIRQYMDEAGIKTGFFTVRMGDRETTHYYSATKVTIPILSKERYDSHYQSLTSEGFLTDYEPGSVFRIGNKEYVLDSSYNLNIPYGEDIYSLEYPKKTN